MTTEHNAAAAWAPSSPFLPLVSVAERKAFNTRLCLRICLHSSLSLFLFSSYQMQKLLSFAKIVAAIASQECTI